MKRYNAVVGGVYDPSVMVEENDGDYVWYEDVERLEAIHAELLEAAERIASRLDNPVLWNFDQRTTVLFDQLRAAIAKAKGGQP